MTFFKNILADLVEKKLWPVAAVLVALLVAVPMTLAKPGDPTATATLPPVPQKEEVGPELALTRTATTGFSRAPRVNDKRLDPFGPRTDKAFDAALKKYLAAANTVIDASVGGGVATDFPTGGGGFPDSGGGVTPDLDPPQEQPSDEPESTTPATERDDLLTVLVTADGEEPKELVNIRTLSPLPDTEDPFLVYVGRAAGNDKATFLVSADVTVSGDGACAPTPQDCRTLTLTIGDTADFVLTTKNNAKVSLTMTDLETTEVVVGGDADTETAAEIEDETRAVGAKALKSVIRDEAVLESLVTLGVKIRS